MRPGCSCDAPKSPGKDDAGGEWDSGRKRFGVPTSHCCSNSMGTGRDSPPEVTRSWEHVRVGALWQSSECHVWVPVDVWGGVCTAMAGRAQLNSPAGEGAGARGDGWGRLSGSPSSAGHPSSNCPCSMQVILGWRRRRRPRSCSGIRWRRCLHPQRGSCHSRLW